MENMEKKSVMRSETSLSAVSYYAAQTHETSEEYLLPDYMPAIRRVLSVQATALPENRFLTGKALEFGGTVAYSVLYVGEGDELFCAPLTSEYTASASLGEESSFDAAAAGIDTVVESVNCRVSAPRRLTLKCRMKTTVTVLHPRKICDVIRDSAGGSITTADEGAIERLLRTAEDVVVSRGEMTAVTSGTIACTGKVISCAAAIRTDSTEVVGGAVTVRGEVHVSALSLSPEGKYALTSVKDPFCETVSVPGAEAGDCARAWGRAASVSVTSGEEGGTWEVEFDLEAESVHTETRTYTADLYSTDCAADVDMGETDSLRLLRCGQGALTVSGESGRQSKAAEGESVLCARALCTPERLEMGDGKLLLSGSCAVSALLLSEGEIVSEEFTLPFRYECDAQSKECGDGLLWRCAVEPLAVTVRPEGDKLSAHVELSLSLCVLSREKIRFAETVTLTKSARRREDDGCIRICYPEAGEPIWELAKRYGVSGQIIRAENGIPETEMHCDGAPILL